MKRRCSQCNRDGHNTRTCSARAGGLRLFGVQLTDESFIKKGASMCNHSLYSSERYHSDDADHGSAARQKPIRKRGTPWTEEEHRQFLIGLQNLGKGKWIAIANKYVHTRSASQIASHAQKYYLRLQSNANRKKKRSSLFDMVPDAKSSTREKLISSDETLVHSSWFSSAANANNNALPCLDLSLRPVFVPFPLQLWPPNAYPHNGDGVGTKEAPNVIQDEPIKELMGMSHLTLAETGILQNESLTFSLSVAGNP